MDLSATPPGVLQMPAFAVIPAGATRTDVTVAAIDDQRPQRLRSVLVQAVGTNLVSNSIEFTVNDSDPYLWTNPFLQMDVNTNGMIEPLDVLVIINEINRAGARFLDPITDLVPPYFDTNPDGRIDPLDVLVVINAINRR